MPNRPIDRSNMRYDKNAGIAPKSDWQYPPPPTHYTIDTTPRPEPPPRQPATIVLPDALGVRQGWVCPKCGRVWAPGWLACGPCNAEVDRARVAAPDMGNEE